MLSSVERMAFYLQVDAGKGRVGGVNNDTPEQQATRRLLILWATSISTSFENYLNRDLLIREREEYFDVIGNGMNYFVRAVPIVEILRVQNDPTGQFDGSEWTLTAKQDYYPGSIGTYVQIWFNMLMNGPRCLRIKYVGGLAYDATKSTYTLKDVAGADKFTAGLYVYCETTESLGRVVSYDAESRACVIENIVGVPIPGETIKLQASLNGQDIPGVSAVIDTVDRASIVAGFPDLDQALMIEARYMQKHQTDFENTSSGGPQGSTYRHTPGDRRAYNFQPETLGILDKYRRLLVGS